SCGCTKDADGGVTLKDRKTAENLGHPPATVILKDRKTAETPGHRQARVSVGRRSQPKSVPRCLGWAVRPTNGDENPVELSDDLRTAGHRLRSLRQWIS